MLHVGVTAGLDRNLCDAYSTSHPHLAAARPTFWIYDEMFIILQFIVTNTII
jgi:hypothetical protein